MVSHQCEYDDDVSLDYCIVRISCYKVYMQMAFHQCEYEDVSLDYWIVRISCYKVYMQTASHQCEYDDVS